ncbi:MAG: cytochrome d ubiquinol oxidase subunit II [Nitrospira sp.]
METETAWFIIVTVTLTMYVVLDGFDFGVGMIYPFVARTEADRRTALDSIGPVWNANEVWLFAAGIRPLPRPACCWRLSLARRWV